MTTKASWRDVLPIHPAAELFPLITGDALVTLGEDIKTFGLMVPIVLWKGDGYEGLLLLEGRSRLGAMERVGIEIVKDGKLDYCAFPYEVHEGDPYAFVVSVNLHRRHLTAEQKRELIAVLLKAQPSKSNREIARQAKASPTTVGEVRSTVQVGQLPEKTIGRDGKARTAARRPRRSQNEIRLENLKRLLDTIEMQGDYSLDIPVPPLSERAAAEAIEQIERSENALRDLKARIRAAVVGAKESVEKPNPIAATDTTKTADLSIASDLTIPEFLSREKPEAAS